MISTAAAIAIITIESTVVVSFRLKLSEVRFFGSVVGDCEVELLIGGIDGEGAGVSLGEVDGKVFGVVSTGAEGKGCVSR